MLCHIMLDKIRKKKKEKLFCEAHLDYLPSLVAFFFIYFNRDVGHIYFIDLLEFSYYLIFGKVSKFTAILFNLLNCYTLLPNIISMYLISS